MADLLSRSKNRDNRGQSQPRNPQYPRIKCDHNSPCTDIGTANLADAWWGQMGFRLEVFILLSVLVFIRRWIRSILSDSYVITMWRGHFPAAYVSPPSPAYIRTYATIRTLWKDLSSWTPIEAIATPIRASPWRMPLSGICRVNTTCWKFWKKTITAIGRHFRRYNLLSEPIKSEAFSSSRIMARRPLRLLGNTILSNGQMPKMVR